MGITHWILIVTFVVGGTPGLAVAETVSSETSTNATSSTVSVATFDPSDFAHSTRSIVLTKLRRFFTLSPAKDAELTDAIANALLLTAMAQRAANQTDQAETTLGKYARESELLGTFVDTLQAGTDDAATQAFLTEFATDRAVQLAAIEATLATNRGSSDLAGKLAVEQAKTLGNIAKVLEQETDPTTRGRQLTQLFDHYAKKQAKLEAKLAKKLTLAARLDDETSDEELEGELEAAEDEAIIDANELDDEAADDLIAELDEVEPGRRAAVLTKLLDKVPANTKRTIEGAIDGLVKEQLKTATDEESLKKFTESHSESKEIQDKLLDRLKEHADRDTKQTIESIKQRVEEEREAAKKNAEQVKEQEKKAEEQTQEANKNESSSDQDDTDESADDSAGSNNTPASGSTPAQSSGSSSSPTPAVSTEKETIEIKVNDEGKLDAASFSVTKSAQLTVKFKNESSASRTLTISNGRSATTGKGETSIAAFTLEGALTFTVSGVSGSGTISVK